MKAGAPARRRLLLRRELRSQPEAEAIARVGVADILQGSLPSAGIAHVLVNGQFVVRGGERVKEALPGRAVRKAKP